MSGYQADIGQNYWGCLYDESRRNKRPRPGVADAALKALRKGGWNQYVIGAMGADIRLALNGVTSVTYRETDPDIARDGRIAVQIHAGGPMEVQFKDIYIQPLPDAEGRLRRRRPASTCGPSRPSKEERKYIGLRPQGYDGTKAFPVVLFLHGSGERGEDGVQQRPGRPRAGDLRQPRTLPGDRRLPAGETDLGGRFRRRQGRPGGARRRARDATRSTATRVILTGLSMGGRGALVDRRGESRAVRGRRARSAAGARPRPPRRSRPCRSGPSSATPTATRPC